MFHRFKDYFHFNKSERKGIIILILLIVCVISFKQSLIFFNPEWPEKSERYDQLIAHFEKAEKDLLQNHKNHENKSSIPARKKVLELKDFNPNNFSIEDWQTIGLSKKQAQVIKNYQAKAGDFESKLDVKKMFVISDELYNRIETHILLPDSAPKKEKKEYKAKVWKREKRILPKIDINTADTTLFKSMYGIGKVLSERIVKYRENLGGFHSKDQLKEIYGLKEETLLNLDTQLIIMEVPLIKLNVNSATVEELKKHPYIRWKVANSIVKYREQHGAYMSVEELKKSVLVTDTIFKKILPYLEK